jgi:hypothetical protein
MIKILTYEHIDHSAWQLLDEQSATATWFQMPEAYEFYASVGDVQAFVYGVSEDDNLVGLVVGYTTTEKCQFKQHFTRRAIIIGGPLIADNISNEALTALLKAVRAMESNGQSPIANRPIYIETRNFHDYGHWKSVFESAGFAYKEHYDIHVYCSAQHRLSERRQRELKRAIKNGATVCEAQTEQEVRDWYQILHRLYREKVRTPLFSEEFFLQFYRNGVGKYLLVKKDDKVIGGMMCPILPGKAIYEWYVCGQDEEYRELSPSVVATHAAIEYAKNNGLPLFDFMGAGVPDVPYGVREFKREFGGEIVEYGRFLYIRKPLLYKIGQIGVRLLKMKR